MRDGIILGKGKGNEDWNCSAPHGAGRVLSRTKANQPAPSVPHHQKSIRISSSAGPIKCGKFSYWPTSWVMPATPS